MVNLEIPWINIMSKMDLVSGKSDDRTHGRNGFRNRRNVARFASSPLKLLFNYRRALDIWTRILRFLLLRRENPKTAILGSTL